MRSGVTSNHLRALLHVSALVRGGANQETILSEVAHAIAHALAVETVVVNVYRAAYDDFVVAEVHGGADARSALLGSRYSSETWQALLDARFERRGAYVLLHGSYDWDGSEGTRYVPAAGSTPDDEQAWHPEDEIFVPIRDSDGETLGVISIGEPASGRRPEDGDLDVLVALAAQAGIALQLSREEEAAHANRRALEELSSVSARLNERLATDEVLREICAGAARGLGFDKVSIHLDDGDGGYLTHATYGYEPDHRVLTTRFPAPDVERLLDPQFEEAGCHLLSHEDGVARVSPQTHVYVSTCNGSGPKAWHRHWLLVPIVGADRVTRGVLWADDPADRLLPSTERLRVLRMFANQAATAIDVGEQFTALERRNEELASLHETTLTLVDQLDLDAVLDSIVARAASLLSTPHAFLYLVDDDGQAMTARVSRGMFTGVGAERRGRGQGISGRVWETGCSELVSDYSTWANRVEAFAGLGTVAAVPLRGRDGVVGVLGLAFDRGVEAGARAGVAQLERYAQLASLALENARLFTAAQSDLADRRAAEEALARSRRLYRTVVESSPDLLTLTARDGTFLYVSPQHRAVLGLDPGELEGKLSGTLVHPDDLDAMATARAEAIRHGEARLEHVRIGTADGEWVPFEITFARIPGAAGGDEPFLVSSGRDISGRLRADDERAALEDQLRHSQKMEAVGLLAGGIAHDFNNLLTGINGYASLVLAKLEDETLVHQVEQIRHAGERAADLTRQLLAFSRKQVLQPELLDLNEVVTSLQSLLRPLLGERVAVRLALDSSIGLVRADPGQLEQVLMHLCVNARDAMPDGGVVELETRRVERVGERLVALVVRDEGDGIPEELRSRIFDPFFTTKGVGRGTGLGLSTVLGIVEQSGGSVELQSGESGSAFEVLLPEVPRVALVPREDARPQLPGIGGHETILVVEDEDAVRRLTIDVLVDLGYSVLHAAHPDEAFALARDHAGAIDVVLTDVVMPDENGPALAARIATIRPDAAMIFMSGYTADALPPGGPAPLGASFLQKPFTREQLAVRVRDALAA